MQLNIHKPPPSIPDNEGLYIYGMLQDDKLVLKNLLECNIADSRREEIAINAKKANEEHKFGKLSFSFNITELKNML